ncbi:MAG TPA: DinB family protein [Candidatus Limnocylindrales bacterium]|nr:DinB family protein [Candidatus Limnocylindrales bacterium]
MTEPAAAQPIPDAEAIDRLLRAAARIRELQPAVAGREPWSLAEDFGVGPEASWGPREVLAHVAEMLPFWLGELERVVEAGSRGAGPVPFGRVAEDPMRLGILDRDRSLPLRELFDRIDVGTDRWERRLRVLTPGERRARGLHVRAGEVAATWIRDRFVVTHLEEHASQLEEIMAR